MHLAGVGREDHGGHLAAGEAVLGVEAEAALAVKDLKRNDEETLIYVPFITEGENKYAEEGP